MTGQEQQQRQPESAFNQRADAAATALKGELSRKLGIDLPETKVPAGSDGRPPQQLPPEGSYAREAIEQQQREEALAALSDAGRGQALPPRQERAAEQPPPEQPSERPTEDVSSRAQARISELIASLREKDQQLQQAQASRTESEQQFRQQMSELQQQYEKMVRAQLDQLDPDTRTEVLQSAAIKQAVAESEQKIMQTLMPKLRRFEERELQHEFASLSQRFPGFNPEVHVPLIQAFRERNPACTIEHAFKAVASLEELTPRESAPVPAVPPSVPPGRGAVSRYQQQPSHQQSDPEAEMREEAQQAYKLLRSADPAERKAGMRMVAQNLENRLSGRLPGQ